MIILLPIVFLWTMQIIVCEGKKCGCDFEKMKKTRQGKLKTISFKTQGEDILCEGDMLVEPETFAELYNSKSDTLMLVSAKRDEKRWPKNTVPYYIDKSFDKKKKNLILTIISEMQKKLKNCIKFVYYKKKPNHLQNYVHILQNVSTSCMSVVGKRRKPRPQFINLGSSRCFRTGAIEHDEMMHTLGFTHEHNRPDRDSFITIYPQNIKSKSCGNFRVCTKCRTFGLPYDYSSLMHYKEKAFPCNKKATIKSKDKNKKIERQREGMSDIDIQKVYKYYQCPQIVCPE